MKSKSIPRYLTWILCTGLAALACSMSAIAADHPCLLLGENEVPALREKIKKEPFASMLARMKADASLGADATPAPISGIVGLDTIWATGGGRYGAKSNGQEVYWRSMNTRYPVDPDEKLTNNGNSGKIVGTPVVNADGSGHCTLSIGRNKGDEISAL